jgi:hypothetical protein
MLRPTLITRWSECRVCKEFCTRYDSKLVFFSNRSGSAIICDDCLIDYTEDGYLSRLSDGWYEILYPIGDLRPNLF